ncbi:MAG: hypothetical protein EKK64_09830 [Neisseriaceae bacterium]|nr:MAG: hypothetical protein EKK64_09830 [Neisseriaceae bacterium]
MSNIFEEIGKKVVSEIVHTGAEVVVDIAKKGVNELHDIVRDKEPVPLPPALNHEKEETK